MMIARHEIVDDSGVLALVDCSAYVPFVGEDWQLDELLTHIQAQARHQSILIWNAGDGGGHYRIEFRNGITEFAGHRSVMSVIRVTNGRLHLVSYTAMTMAAQFADETLPATMEAGLFIPLDNGAYVVRLVQTFDPDCADAVTKEHADFVLELQAGSGISNVNVAWFPVEERGN